MKHRNPAVDAFIARAPAFARPILRRVRAAFHAGCPEVEERIKWGSPSFEYKGILGGMAAFKRHVSFGFWKSRLLPEFERSFGRPGRASAMGVRIETLQDLPPQRALVAFVRAAKRLNDAGVKEPLRAAPRRKPPLPMPADVRAALARNAKARAAFASLPPSHQRAYLEWITEAKRPATRARRLAASLTQLTAGQPLHARRARAKKS